MRSLRASSSASAVNGFNRARRQSGDVPAEQKGIIPVENNEQQIMTIIGSAGASKGKAFAALACVRERDYEGARALLAEAKEADLAAHAAQTEVITRALSGAENAAAASLLMVHAQDHYMTSQLARDLIEEIVKIFEERDAEAKQA